MNAIFVPRLQRSGSAFPPGLWRAWFSGLALLAALPVRGPAIDSQVVKRLFADPPREYATAPLWVWNDLLTERQIRDTLNDLAGQKVRQVFVHPRPGLMTPYLSADWFRLWKVALDEAEKLDLNVWIYDENSYPSGFAGGWVPEALPESRGLGLHLKEVQSVPQWSEDLVAVFRLPGGRVPVEDITARAKAGGALPEGHPYLVARVQRAGNSPWHGNRCYVNLLTPGVTEKFLEVTLEAYRREVGAQFGKRIPGSFTDEPEIRPAGGLPWCADLPARFQQRWGYSLVENLASLALPVGDWRKVRHNYFSTLNDLFIERWAKPYHDWCERHGLAFTGHYWDHEWPNCAGVPNNMAMASWQQVPGIDCLMNQYREDTHAQFGNVRMVRELNSVANQLGRARRLCEIYGAGGWELRFEDMKRIADWLGVLGVNLFDEHLSYVTLRGARKRDHPQSFSYHEPWWEDYHVMANYITRLSCALSQGEQINRVLVLEPTTTAWMYQGDGAKLATLGNEFCKLLLALDAAQVEYDLGDEYLLAQHGKNEGKALRVGRRLYHTVVIPPLAENLDGRTWELLHQFIGDGGRGVLCCAKNLRRDGGDQLNPEAGCTQNQRWQRLDAEAVVRQLTDAPAADGFRITRANGDAGKLFHNRRQLDDGELLLLVNTSLEAPSAGDVESALPAVEEWDLHTGATRAFPFAPGAAGGVRARFSLPPSGSLLLFLSRKAASPAPPPGLATNVLAATGPIATRRLGPNVLTLDYVDVTARGETRSNVYFYAANQFAWKRNGFDRNPWDSAVQFRDELLTRQFAPDSGFSASYRFTIEGTVPEDLALVVERPDLYTITCNGQPVAVDARPRPRDAGASTFVPPGGDAPEFTDWWLDKAFGRLPIAKLARTGENVVTLRAAPMTIFHELEPAYVLGRFTLRAAARGFVIAPDAPLAVKPAASLLTQGNNPVGTMWLTRGIGFAPEAGQPDADRAPAITFDLGASVEWSAVRIWNYAESHVHDLTTRGTKAFRLAVADAADGPARELGEFTLALARAGDAPQTFTVPAGKSRFVTLEIRSNHNGVRYPAEGEPLDNGFVGLGEVQFLDAAGQPLRGVRVARASSELTSHQRRAAHLVDGSGLVEARPGWNQQGHPFYAAGVAYRCEFSVEGKAGRYAVVLPDWLGSVARVRVNDRAAGHVFAPPWEADVTQEIRPGVNTIEVTVIGTLKNTLGPHHNGANLGSAWPGMFQRGPDNGPPPGAAYHTVGHGLFGPFRLEQRRAAQ